MAEFEKRTGTAAVGFALPRRSLLRTGVAIAAGFGLPMPASSQQSSSQQSSSQQSSSQQSSSQQLRQPDEDQSHQTTQEINT